MKAGLACIPCIMKQAYNTARRATDDERVIRDILERTADYVKTVDLDQAPADASNFAYWITREITGIDDPYEKDKRMFNDLCMERYDRLLATVRESDDPLKAAVRLAIMGNVIDMGIGFAFDIDEEIERFMNRRLAVDDYDDFRHYLDEGKRNILYLLDNAGEIVFDKILVSMLVKRHTVTCVVKSGPIINDATRSDVDDIGLSDMVDIIETGSNGIGVKWDAVTEEFMEQYDNADCIVSKGKGNFETMSEKRKRTYFLLKAKCDSVAEKLGVEFGDIVFRKGPVI